MTNTRNQISKFYNTQAWKKCREAYKKHVGGLCEICLKQGLYNPGEVVHHKIHITTANMNDPAVLLNFDNLQCICRKHHEEIHNRASKKRYVIDEQGRVIISRPPMSEEMT